jgi:hypothetical protein
MNWLHGHTPSGIHDLSSPRCPKRQEDSRTVGPVRSPPSLSRIAGAPIGEGVVRDDAFIWVMPWRAKCAAARVEERGRGGSFLVREDLGIGEAGVVIDRSVDVVAADAEATDLFLTAVDPTAPAVRDPTEFLHVNVD